MRSVSSNAADTTSNSSNSNDAAKKQHIVDSADADADAVQMKIELWRLRVDALEIASRQALLRVGDDGSSSRERLEELIAQWSALLLEEQQLPAVLPIGTAKTAELKDGAVESEASDQLDSSDFSSSSNTVTVERMHDLYRAWTTMTSTSPIIRTNTATATPVISNKPYEVMLATFSSGRRQSGPRALQVLQEWEVALGGDLELAPREAHYQAVLAAYAGMMHHSSNSNNNAATTPPPLEAVDVALEIVQHLEQSWSAHNDFPNIHTYQHAVHILSRAMRGLLRHEGGGSHNNGTMNGGEEEELQQARITQMPLHFENLQTCMDKFLQKLSPKMSDEQFSAMVLTLSDALHGWKAMQNFQQQQWNDDNDESPTEYNTNAGFDSTSLQRREEWWMHWGRLVQAGNADLWLRVKQDDFSEKKYIGLAVLEQTCMAVLEMHHRDLLSSLVQTSDDDTGALLSSSCIGSVEAMTQHVLQLHDMMRTCAAGSFLPSGRHYQRTIQAWGHLKKHADTDEYLVLAQQHQGLLLQRMQEQHARNYSLPQTAVEHEHASDSWNELLRAYLDAGVPGRVKELWDQNAEVKMGRIHRTQESFTVLFQSLAAKRQPDAPMKAQERAKQAHSLLNKLVTYNPAARKFEPMAEHFASVMIAWSRSYHPNAAPYCQQVFGWMLEEANRANQGGASVGSTSNIAPIIPSAIHYTALITTWGFSRLPGSMQHVLEIFNQMRTSGIKLDIKSYTSVLFALSRSQSVEGAQEAERILNSLEEKEVNEATRRRGAIGKTTDDSKPDNARSMSRSEPTHERSRPPSDISRNQRDNRSRQPNIIRHVDEADPSFVVEPTLACYNSVMYAWCHSGVQDAPARCEAVFRRLMAVYEKSGWDPALRPDSTSFVTLIDSIVNKQLKTEEASPVPSARAEEILFQMEAQAAKGLADFPDAKVYTAVMKAHWKSGQTDAALKVEIIIRRMKEAYEAGSTAAKPDAHAMTVLLQTWAKSDAPNKATIAWEIHKEMRNAYEHGDIDMRPNAYSLSAVLNACAFTNTHDQRTRSDAVKIALMTMNELDNGVSEGLNEFTFRNMFQVIVNQIDDLQERTRFAGVIFQRCCQAGYVSRGTLMSLKKNVPSLYQKLPASPDKKLELPEQWTRHVAKDSRHDASWDA